MKILFINDQIGEVGGAEIVIKNVIAKSRHKINVLPSHQVTHNDIEENDIIHLHNVGQFLKRRNVLNGSKYVCSIHDYRLHCPNSLGTCQVYDIGCLKCMGFFRYLARYFLKHRPFRELALKSSGLIVHSEYMKQFYKEYETTYLPIPLETDKTDLLHKDEEYLFFSSRCSHEKNPLAFIDLCKQLDVEGIMTLYNLTTGPLFKEYITKMRTPNVEIFYDLEVDQLFDLYRHAHLTVHPHLYAEPFGIGSANSILLGTPLITYPFGNLNNLATRTASNYGALVKIVKQTYEDPEFYQRLLDETEVKRMNLTKELDSIDMWDEYYESL